MPSGHLRNAPGRTWTMLGFRTFEFTNSRRTGQGDQGIVSRERYAIVKPIVIRSTMIVPESILSGTPPMAGTKLRRPLTSLVSLKSVKRQRHLSSPPHHPYSLCLSSQLA